MVKALTRALAIPIILLAGWWSFNQWLYRIIAGKDFEARQRFANFFGWNDPKMDLHWERLWSHLPWKPDFDWDAAREKGYSGRPGSPFHALKNMLVEWPRLEAERTGKFGSWLIVNLTGVAVLGFVI